MGHITKTKTQQLIGKILYKKSLLWGKNLKVSSKDQRVGVLGFFSKIRSVGDPNTQSMGPIGTNLHSKNIDFWSLGTVLDFV